MRDKDSDNLRAENFCLVNGRIKKEVVPEINCILIKYNFRSNNREINPK